MQMVTWRQRGARHGNLHFDPVNCVQTNLLHRLDITAIESTALSTYSIAHSRPRRIIRIPTYTLKSISSSMRGEAAWYTAVAYAPGGETVDRAGPSGPQV